MKKRTALIVLGLLMSCLLPMTFGMAQQKTDLGVFTLPKTVGFTTESGEAITLPQGEYRLMLFGKNKNVSVVLVSEKDENVFGCPTTVTEVKENYSEPKSEIFLVTKDGIEYVQIVICKGSIQAVSMLKCME